MSRKTTIFAPQLRTIVQQFAQMAESVDALVSNTSGFTSIPVRPRVWVQNLRRILFEGFFQAHSDLLHHQPSIEKESENIKKNGRTPKDPPNFAKLTQYT